MELQSVKQRFGIIGRSSGLNRALEVAARVAPTNLSVLITGESGVGKEVFSHIIHQLSPRKHNGFIAVNCGAIPEGTIDAELFGHEKGSFTGAHEKRKGYFETVSGGTIFLDEIGEMPLGTQARLLRVLESGEFIKVGSSQVQKTDVRVLAATNVDLPKLIRIGKFREDLYYRLNTVPIHVPALRERKEDIPLLFRKFTTDFAEKYKSQSVQLSDEALTLLTAYHFPGNIRELKNIAEQISVLARNKVLGADELREFLPAGPVSTLPALVGGETETAFSDRELLYKMIFDIKHDLNDLKRFVWNMSQGNFTDTGIDFSDVAGKELAPKVEFAAKPIAVASETITPKGGATLIINEEPHYAEESVDRSLSITDMEKQMILKALDKHRGKRKDAALDLGISERTLYRKIKEYDLEK